MGNRRIGERMEKRVARFVSPGRVCHRGSVLDELEGKFGPISDPGMPQIAPTFMGICTCLGALPFKVGRVAG